MRIRQSYLDRKKDFEELLDSVPDGSGEGDSAAQTRTVKDEVHITLFPKLVQLRREVETLRNQDRLKFMALLPECEVKAPFVRLDTNAIASLANQEWMNTAPLGTKRESKWDWFRSLKGQEEAWGTLFDLTLIRKLKNVKKGWKFNWSVQTDGVSASFDFTRFVRKFIVCPIGWAACLPGSLEAKIHFISFPSHFVVIMPEGHP